ncbi:non-hydrolyzing UDP-N-acetylglucosamine 2-epimerase [Bacteroidota bacterium]
MKVANIVGARPQFIKCASLSREIRNRTDIEEYIIHTGQHYDLNMSEIFFSELDIPEPNLNLGVGSGSHADQTARMLTALEKTLLEVKPDWVLVYGDTNSTMAGALAAAKLNLRIAHVEAGLRSFNRNMPEEINRIVTDHVADLLFAPTQTAMDLLEKEGLAGHSILTGDVMYDSVLHSQHLAEQKYGNKEIVPYEKFYLATVHRQENTDNAERLEKIFAALSSMDLPVVLPLHPRTKNFIDKANPGSNIKIIEPVGYLEMLMLIQGSEKVLTDSGGLQKEAFFLNKQCITLREETEWTETLAGNWNILAGTDPETILRSLSTQTTAPRGNYFGDGQAAKKILDSLPA